MPTNLFLTFDDGPTVGTEETLDALKNTSATATFFLTGSNEIAAGGAAAQKRLAERMIDEGHGLANHCYLHVPATRAQYTAAYGNMTTDAQKAAFRKNFDDNLAHFRNRLSLPSLALKQARLPGDGRFVRVCVDQTQAIGLTHIGWDYEFAPNGTMAHIDKQNWQGVTGVACTFDGLPPNNNVLLLHDAHWQGRRALLESLLNKLKANGAVFKRFNN